MNDEEKLKIYVDLWKQTVDVQKHFNDIELRIRGLALTALTFTLGAAALAVKDGTATVILGARVPFATLILLIGTALWLAFYFVDGVWYHRLLIGSVVHGTALEAKIAELIPLSGDDGTVGLTGQISRSSPYPVRIGTTQHHAWTWYIHSSTKLKLFYWLVAAILLLFAVIAVKADQSQPGAPHPAVTPTAPASQHP